MSHLVPYQRFTDEVMEYLMFIYMSITIVILLFEIILLHTNLQHFKW